MLKRKAPPTPSEMLDTIRVAQDRHAEEVQAANARLLDTHQETVAKATDRRVAIQEQITLLQTEAQGLREVERASVQPRLSTKEPTITIDHTGE